MKFTPATPSGLHKYDSLPAVEAVRLAWLVEGRNPAWNRNRKRGVAAGMPLLARALDRLVADNG